MAKFNPYTEIISPVIEALQADPRFAGVNIFYDARKAKVPEDLMPAINCFWLPPGQDTARGSQASSLQTRREWLSLGFCCWNTGPDASADQSVWEMAGNIKDWMHEHVDFSPGISVRDAKPIQVDTISPFESPPVRFILVEVGFEVFLT